ncbi:polyhydroxyalkanoate depolymerase [Exilibacterium tricleocarpae]|uniref:Polyhydroxyalkanoate depolymerase n=1 Tax=Exilibacterium tricleocarpae TaxID=2591008 RepID=A0A545SYS1_9GAMM|nr:polyhydroxyalkanoate depolymerase [Exilibacterium tricleocarpae]TQV70114.1 polyhydroxyalkanoate depolymerase [Exilibacterium tricleocarpae]
MLYHLYELSHAAVRPLRVLAKTNANLLSLPFNPAAYSVPGRFSAATSNFFLSVTRRYGKPDWGIDQTRINGYPVRVKEKVVWENDFCRLLHFKRKKKDLLAAHGHRRYDPRVLLVAPLSGHYATLLRGTVEAMLPEHEVYVTDWEDARNVPVGLGRFDLNDYVDYVIDMLHHLGPAAHVIGICQPGPPVLAAVSLMAAAQDPNRPATMTFMGSPIDTRRSPTVPNKLAMERSYAWFEQNMIYSVPWPNPGVMRRVYPGFLQLGGFITMNPRSHLEAHEDYFNHLVEGDCDSIQKHREFYDEYLAVLDLTEEFYLQTIREVFQDHHLARGVFRHRGELVQPGAITDVALMTVEGEKDDISGIGQTQAAHDLCGNIPAAKRFDYVQPGVGHYGVFNGRRFRSEVQPRLRDFIRSHFDWKREADYRG